MKLDKINEAFEFAGEKHSKQMRKTLKVPYLVHLYEVFQNLREDGADEATLIAGILHDTVEDTGTSLKEIEDKFGKEVATLVDFCSEGDKSIPYIERKFEHEFRLLGGPKKARLIKCADALSNFRTIFLDEKYDDNPWAKFHAPKEDVLMVYFASLDVFEGDLSGTKVCQNLRKYFDAMVSKEEQDLIAKRVKNYLNENLEKFRPVYLKAKESLAEEDKNLQPQPVLKSTKAYVCGKVIEDCKLCPALEVLPDPDPYDWFCDDEVKYKCLRLNRVLSSGNKPCEGQVIPADCPEKI